MEASMSVRKVTVATLAALKARNEKAVFVTAYDYPTATFADRAGVDMILVGDSAAMTMLGLPSTLQIGLDEMLVFIRAVTRAAQRAFVIGDLPFLSYQPSDETAIRSAGAFVAAGCDAVKCEGGARVAQRVRAMVDAGIAVMGHLGLTPQNLGQLGGYRVQGKSLAAAEQLLRDAEALSGRGCSRFCSRPYPLRRRRLCGSASVSSFTGSAPGHTWTGSSSFRPTCSATAWGTSPPGS